MVVQEEFLTREEWAKVVRRHLATNQFEVLNISLRRLSEGGGFHAEHRLAEVTVRLHEPQPLERVLHYFVKAQPQALPEQRKMAEETGLFAKEVPIFNKLFVELRSVLEDSGEDMKWCCESYFTRPDVIVFENVSVQNFHMPERTTEFRWHHCATLLKALANLHSASLIFEEKHPTKGYRLNTEFANDLRVPFFLHKPDHPGTLWFESGVRVVWRLVEEIRGTEFLRGIKTQIEEAMWPFFKLVKTSDRFRNVVSHGDIWRNNMFFRYEEGKPVEARMCDFQMTHYSPPANDVTCFLYLTTTRAFRKENYSKLISYYHEQLSHNLRRHDLDPDKVLPWEEFKESCEYYRTLGVITASLYDPLTLLSEDDLKPVMESSKEYERIIKHDRIPEAMKAFKNDSLYQERLIERIEELIELCFEKK